MDEVWAGVLVFETSDVRRFWRLFSAGADFGGGGIFVGSLMSLQVLAVLKLLRERSNRCLPPLCTLTFDLTVTTPFFVGFTLTHATRFYETGFS